MWCSVVRHAYTALCGAGPAATVASTQLAKRKWVVTAYLVFITLVTLIDTITDIVVTTEWYVGGARTYAYASMVIMSVAAIVSTLWARAACNRAEVPSCVVPLAFMAMALLNLQMLPWAELTIYDLWTGHFPPEVVLSAAGVRTPAAARRRVYRLTCVKMLESVFEATPQLVLQSYMAAYHGRPTALLQTSMAMSVWSIAQGMSMSYFCYEHLRTQIAGGLYFAATLVARIALCVMGFIASPRLGLAFAVWVVGSRLSLLSFLDWYWLTNVDDADSPLAKGCAVVRNVFFYVVFSVPTLVVVSAVPLGYRVRYYGAEAESVVDTALWGTFDRNSDFAVAGNIYNFGNSEPSDCQSIRTRFASPLAQILITLHLVENLTMLAILSINDASFVAMMQFVVVPSLVAMLLYVLLYWGAKHTEAEWKRELDNVKTLLGHATELHGDTIFPLIALPEHFEQLPDYVQGKLFIGNSPTPAQCIERCDWIISQIDNGTLDNPELRKALDLLLVGMKCLRASDRIAPSHEILVDDDIVCDEVILV